MAGLPQIGKEWAIVMFSRQLLSINGGCASRAYVG
jgi:hypothetical protein